ncbi:MAG: hypothetical protein JXR59_04165 [Desulfuromonadaceae bacterium]|nr:hypothetical protein [Desulfuromonadaceae bacterium]
MSELRLPMPAIELLPHRPPMLLIDELLECQPTSGRVTARFDANSLFADRGGQIEPVVMVELLAQAWAAVKGWQDRSQGLPVRQGYLVGGRSVTVYQAPRIGESLSIVVELAGEIDGFAVIDGQIVCGKNTLAEGSLKLWIP